MEGSAVIEKNLLRGSAIAEVLGISDNDNSQPHHNRTAGWKCPSGNDLMSTNGERLGGFDGF